jgi:hypothetical protein
MPAHLPVSRRCAPDRKVVGPNRVAAERAHKLPVCVAIISSYRQRQRVGARSDVARMFDGAHVIGSSCRVRLARRGQLDIDRG